MKFIRIHYLLVLALTTGCTSLHLFNQAEQSPEVPTAPSDVYENGAIVLAAGVESELGVQMDRQEANLRKSLSETGVQIERNGNEIKLVLPGNMTFDTGSATLKSKMLQALESVATVINQYPQTRMDISGHTDSSGSAELNERLSEQRAQKVAEYLISHGIKPGHMSASGYGFSYPIATNKTKIGRTLNRRIEIELRSI